MQYDHQNGISQKVIVNYDNYNHISLYCLTQRDHKYHILGHYEKIYRKYWDTVS